MDDGPNPDQLRKLTNVKINNGLFQHLCETVDRTDASDLDLMVVLSTMLGQLIGRLPADKRHETLEVCVTWAIRNGEIPRPRRN